MRQDQSTTNNECLTIELRLNYSNEVSDTNGYYRRNTIELRLDYLSSIIFETNDIQNDEDDLFKINVIFINNNKQDKIKLNTFPSNLNQLIADIRIQLIEQGTYVMAERIVIFSQRNNSDVLVVDNITWKRITLTF
ncbi:unnamed protein product [Adineta steineri]|uniref:Uncharacterized protein n=1 Tax=Adineta steineri TaxID=433720 RepID=A0A819ZSC5_9BILA|nr:unnamed protein product [Adineta steineri]